jgi:hypothetical protein
MCSDYVLCFTGPGRQDRRLACIILGSGQATRHCSGRFGLVRPMPDMFQSVDLSLRICPDHRSEPTKAQAMHGAVTGRTSQMECNEAGCGHTLLSNTSCAQEWSHRPAECFTILLEAASRIGP